MKEIVSLLKIKKFYMAKCDENRKFLLQNLKKLFCKSVFHSLKNCNFASQTQTNTKILK